MVIGLEPPREKEHRCAGCAWRSTSFLIPVACSTIIFSGTSFVLSQITGASPASRAVVATIRQKGSQSAHLLPAVNHLVSNSQRQVVSMPWCQLGCCVVLLLAARTTKRGYRTQRAASCKLVVAGSPQKEAQQYLGSGKFPSSTFTCNVVVPAADALRFASVASSTQPQVMQSSMSSQQYVAGPSMLTRCWLTCRGQESSSRKAGGRARRTSTRAERKARRAVGQRLLRASEQCIAIQLSYDASRVRTKMQLVLLAPEHLHSERPREVKTTAASHTLNDQFVVRMPAYTNSIGVSFPDY